MAGAVHSRVGATLGAVTVIARALAMSSNHAGLHHLAGQMLARGTSKHTREQLKDELDKIKARALPKDLPEVIIVDVTHLKIGESVHLGDIKAPEGVEILGDKNLSVLAVAAPVQGDEATITNHGWRVSRPELRATLALDELLLVNDFAALAWASGSLYARTAPLPPGASVT